MSTSGTVTFNVARDDICNGAARKLRILQQGELLPPNLLTNFAQALNAMVKRWSRAGIHVWTTKEATLFPAVDQIKYPLGPGASSHCAETIYETAVTSDTAYGLTSIPVDDTTNMTVGDYIGIILDDGTIHWSTVVSKTSIAVVIALALVDNASSLTPVYSYTSNISRPLKVVGARRYEISSATETPITISMRLDYLNLPLKTQRGAVSQVWYDAQMTTGYLNLWMAPEATTQLIKFTWQKLIEDFSSAADNPDMPQEWIDTLIFNLAEVMMPEHPVPDKEAKIIVGLAAKFLDEMQGADREEGSVFFAPERRR